jgi:ATP-binding cassette subfamily C protein
MLGQLLAMLTRRERWQVCALAVLALAAALAEALSIGVVFPFMALLVSPETVLEHPAARMLLDRIGSFDVDRLVLIAACGLLALFLLKNLFLVGFYAFQSHFVCSVESRLGVALLTIYLRAPFTERLARNSMDRIQIVSGEVGRVTIGVMLSVIALFSEGLVVTAIALLLLFAQPLVALVVLGVVGVVALLMQSVFRRKLDAHRQSRVETLSGMLRWVNEGLGALREIKVFGREQHVIDEFTRNSRVYAHGTYVFTTLNLLPRLIFETAAVSALLLAVVATVIAGKSLHEIVPTLTIFGLAAVRLLPSASRIVASLNTLRYYVPAVDTVAADLKLAQAPAIALPSASTAVEQFASLQLQNVSYSYPGSSEPSLRDIHLHIKHGEGIAVLGRSGSGKTTLADVLLGLLEPDTGTIQVNGRPTRSLRQDWRGIAGIVPQEFFLIDDQLRRNVAFGLPDNQIDDARVWSALRMAQLEARVRELPQGIGTPIGERGATLSGGERQRLGIARALYHDPQILILDEATSALDTQTEREVSETIGQLMGRKTLIIIAHRMSTARRCHRVLYLERGRVMGSDAFDALLETNSSFRDFVRSGL